ncbi:MAG: NAD(P)H-dependent oxidoreductase [Nitrospiraceae bacterium]|nr:NAD(P)H-dependent oxidoreductase [Nitrospiraceae bacterium]
MSKLLHIQSSPRGERSASITVASKFTESYKAAHLEDTVETVDLWKAELPEFDGAVLDAKYAILNGQPHTAAQLEAWTAVVKLCEHFKSADKYVISLPMWNFSIPYKLKHYIDLLAQPGLTFSFTPAEGYKGLVTGKPLVAVYARGGAYGPGSGAETYDQQSAFIKQIFGFIGFTEIHEIFVEPTLAGLEVKEEAMAGALRSATDLAFML